MSLPVEANSSLTITGPGQSSNGLALLETAAYSDGIVSFNGPTQLRDQKGALLATVTGSLPGTLQLDVTVAGRPPPPPCVDDEERLREAGITAACSDLKALAGVSVFICICCAVYPCIGLLKGNAQGATTICTAPRPISKRCPLDRTSRPSAPRAAMHA